MIKLMIGLLVRVREIFLAVLVIGMAYMGISPDSQHGIIHKIVEFSEYGHIWLTFTTFLVFAVSFLIVSYRHRKGIARIWKRLIDEARQIGK